MCLSPAIQSRIHRGNAPVRPEPTALWHVIAVVEQRDVYEEGSLSHLSISLSLNLKKDIVPTEEKG